MKILVAADGSRYTKRMLAYIAAHDEWLGAHHRYTVMTVVGPLPARATRVLDKQLVQGYFAADPDSRPGALVFNRTVTLKDAWARIEKKQGDAAQPGAKR